MLPDTARWLVSDEGREVLARPIDPDSLGDAERLRREFDDDRAAAVTSQVALRRKARAKFGDDAAAMFFTSAGLEQASRPEVSAWRASRFSSEGVGSVVDLGCGIGADAMALVRAGIAVRPVEIDRVTAVFAQANLGMRVEVADATTVPIGGDEAVFIDPARRTARGRTWRVEDFTPAWDFVVSLLHDRVACVKLGPGVPKSLLPDDVATTWVSVRGDVVEASVWSIGDPGSRSAVLLPGGFTLAGSSDGPLLPAAEPAVGDIVLEPDGAIIAAGLVDTLAAGLGARRIHPGIAYLVSDSVPSTAATAFLVDEALPYNEKTLRAWVRANHIGTLEIKKRGIDIDPAVLRKRLRTQGPNSATLILTPTPRGSVALVVRRCVGGEHEHHRWHSA